LAVAKEVIAVKKGEMKMQVSNGESLRKTHNILK